MNRDWIDQTVARLVSGAPENRLSDFRGLSIFDAPLVGIADGDDPVFPEFTKAVSPRHLQPRAFLRSHFPKGPEIGYVSVISWVLPFTGKIRLSNRNRKWPSGLYSLARNHGEAVNREVSRRLVKILRDKGFAAAAPVLSPEYDCFRSPEYIYGSSWSERHAAVAAGLGRFGLNGALITPRGINVRLGSIITNFPLTPTPRHSGSRFAPCLESRSEICDRCIGRCPVGAVSRSGLDKKICNARRKAIGEKLLPFLRKRYRIKRFLIPINGSRRWTYPLGCALCQCGVPCEGRDPFSGAQDKECST
jgi:epoxyqueuosine reductase